MDAQRFQKITEEIISRTRESNEIGTLSEKTVHSVLKHYYEPDEVFHEVKIGRYYADIRTGNCIYEIQTANFNKLRAKLVSFLKEYEVTLVYPIPYTKWIRWIHPETGEISQRRKSPKLGSPYQVFRELYRIKEFLVHPNLHLELVLIDMEEYRYLNGWSSDEKKGSTRAERIPIALKEQISIRTIADYEQLIPKDLPEIFTSSDYQKASKLTKSRAQTALLILNYLQIVNRVGKSKNQYLYEKSKEKGSM